MVTRHALAMVLALLAVSSASGSLAAQRSGLAVRDDLYVVPAYDPARSPEADLRLAVARARAERKHILLDVGGNWCVWCHVLDNYLARDRAVGDAFRASFVILKINWSPENENTAFLGRYPEVDGYPHFFVLDSAGAFVANQPTSPLERGESYDQAKMLAFAERWRVLP
jgi:thiol:disulfide interchange protein